MRKQNRLWQINRDVLKEADAGREEIFSAFEPDVISEIDLDPLGVLVAPLRSPFLRCVFVLSDQRVITGSFEDVEDVEDVNAFREA